MKDKYSELIGELKMLTESYETALKAVLYHDDRVEESKMVIGISGGVAYYGERFERNRSIHISHEVLISAALDCNQALVRTDNCSSYHRFSCDLFGYKVFCVAEIGSSEHSKLIKLVQGSKH